MLKQNAKNITKYLVIHLFCCNFAVKYKIKMLMMENINHFAPLLSFIASALLLIVTLLYTIFTKRLLNETMRQNKYQHNPVIAFKLKRIGGSPVFGPSRRNLSAEIELINVGNAPAIEILIDAEITFTYSSINGTNIIPQRFEPSMIPYIKQGSTIDSKETHINFGNNCITALFDDFRECHRLNIHRIETNPSQTPYNASKLSIYAYYKNSSNQYFQSKYEVYLSLDEIPKENQQFKIKTIYIPRPTFDVITIESQELSKIISTRTKKRDLCGW